MITPSLPRPHRTTKTPHYIVRLVQTPQDLQAAQRVRFEVFNLELQEGLEESYHTGRDHDPFDEFCDHLIVEQVETGKIVGTYRLQTGALAAANLGYYSEQEFDFSPYEPWRCEMVELGRACVHRDHRHFGVLNLLWRGIALYAVERKARYLIGCSSLTSQDTHLGAAMYHHLKHKYEVAPPLRTHPTARHAFPLDTKSITDSVEPPRLLQAYLAIGAKICGPPAIDRAFKTIDFLTLLDLENLPRIVRERFLNQ